MARTKTGTQTTSNIRTVMVLWHNHKLHKLDDKFVYAYSKNQTEPTTDIQVTTKNPYKNSNKKHYIGLLSIELDFGIVLFRNR